MEKDEEMIILKLKCPKCGWQGTEDQAREPIIHIWQCPKCGTIPEYENLEVTD